MTILKRLIMWAGLCITALSATAIMGTSASSAAGLLFLPASHKFPYHLAGIGLNPKFETVGGKALTAEKVDGLVQVLSTTLFDAHLKFLKVASSGAPCSNTANVGEVLLNALGHFGLADPGFVPAIMILVPSGFKFTCELFGVKSTILLKGSIVGRILSPAIGQDTELMSILLNQVSAGQQEFSTFLPGGETFIHVFAELSENEGAFEQAALSGPPALIHALPGEGKFLLTLP